MSKDEYRVNGKVFLSVAKAATTLGVSAETVRKRCRDGSLRAVKVGAQWFVHVPEATNAPKANTQKAQKTLQQSAVVATPVPLKIAQQLISRLPTKPVSSLPAAYAKSLPMIVGVLTVLALALLAAHPSFSDARVRIASKTDVLKTQLTATAVTGATSLVETITEVMPALPTPAQERTADRSARVARPAALSRTLTAGNARIDIVPRMTEAAYTVSSAAAALYSIELLTTSGE